MRAFTLLVVMMSAAWGQAPGHPLDGLTTAEYWTVYDTLQSAERLTPETFVCQCVVASSG